LAKRREDPNGDGITQLVVQFFSCNLSKDGGGKITFEFGAESLEAIQSIQTWHNDKPRNFAIAVKPLDE